MQQDITFIRHVADIAQRVHQHTAQDEETRQYAAGVEDALRWVVGDGNTESMNRILAWAYAPAPRTWIDEGS